MHKVEHIGIAVKDLSTSISLYERLLGSPCYKTERVDSEQVNTAFFQKGETKIELLQGLTPDSVITRYVEKKGEGMHHIAFEVTDIHAEMQRLATAGFTLLNETPKAGADNKWICFLHPKDTNGVLIELCMERKV
jgi:methylmalonyl-CoA/ethylmalonyl-CoA epimerase